MRVALTVFITAAAALAADQASKWLVRATIEPYTTLELINGFQLVHTSNRGVSFGLFASDSHYSPYILSLVGFCIVVFLSIWALKAESRIQRYGLALIIGGAISNILDRLDDGGVTDFLDFYIGAYHWPAFNLADVAIVCGVGVLLLETAFPAAFKKREYTQ